MKSRGQLRSVLCLGLLVIAGLGWVVQASEDDPVAIPVDREADDIRIYTWQDLNRMSSKERARVVQEMSLVEKEKLRKKWDHFKGLDQDAKEKNRLLYQQVVAHPQGERLHQVMVRYHEWLSGLRSSQRADLLSLPPEERIKRIQQIVREQEQRKFAELLEKELPANDLTSISKWLEELWEKVTMKIKAKEAEIMASLDSEQKAFFEQFSDPQQRRRVMAMGMLSGRFELTESRLAEILSMQEELPRLREQLSSRGQGLFDQAEGVAEQMVLVRQWIRAASMSRRKALPRVSDETLEAFRRGELATESNPEFKLKPEDQERLEHLSGERLKQQLKWYYYRYRGDLEPGGSSRSGSRVGRGSGGRRGSSRSGGSGRPGGNGRTRLPERNDNQFIERGFPSPRSP
ncbi:MAG: hypothetical protein GY888_32835 [Planctomycetaceae bacterium]|jgi:hypothetical protein|nr:hypothetical protein [Planctomycetaceae bacterium]